VLLKELEEKNLLGDIDHVMFSKGGKHQQQSSENPSLIVTKQSLLISKQNQQQLQSQ
jgi:hypothetical protein